MERGSVIPISDEQSKALQEAIKTLRAAGGYLAEILGTVPHDVVGLLGGDWLRVKRAENFSRIVEKAHERLRARHVESEPASLSVGLPILVAAAEESREELQDLWARLLAAAADPGRSRSFRIAFIETAQKMDPPDAALLEFLYKQGEGFATVNAGDLPKTIGLSFDEVHVSLRNLSALGLLDVQLPWVRPTAFGREFFRIAVSD